MKQAKKIAKLIKKSNKIVFFHHVKPDGDSLSCSYGLMKAIQKKYPEKEVKWYADIDFIKTNFNFLISDFKDVIKKLDSSWTAIIGDNAVSERVFGFKEFKKAGTKICFDHHVNTINFDCDYYWPEPTLGASSVQAYEIAKAAKVPFNNEIALSMIFGILTDTYNFTYSLAETWPLKASIGLMKYIDNESMDKMYKSYRKRTQKDLAFQAFVLSNYKIKEGVAYLKITDKDQKQLNLNADQVNRVNLIGNIEGVHIWMFLVEDKENNTLKVSLRSLGFPVNELAKKLGGGGHKRASGIKLNLDDYKPEKIIKNTIKDLKLFLERK